MTKSFYYPTFVYQRELILSVRTKTNSTHLTIKLPNKLLHNFNLKVFATDSKKTRIRIKKITSKEQIPKPFETSFFPTPKMNDFKFFFKLNSLF